MNVMYNVTYKIQNKQLENNKDIILKINMYIYIKCLNMKI